MRLVDRCSCRARSWRQSICGLRTEERWTTRRYEVSALVLLSEGVAMLVSLRIRFVHDSSGRAGRCYVLERQFVKLDPEDLLALPQAASAANARIHLISTLVTLALPRWHPGPRFNRHQGLTRSRLMISSAAESGLEARIPAQLLISA